MENRDDDYLHYIQTFCESEHVSMWINKGEREIQNISGHACVREP